MLAATDLLKCGLRRTIGSGFNTRVWFDNWIPSSEPRLARDNGAWRDPKMYVNHLIDHSAGEWKLDLLQNICDPEDVKLIQSIKPSRRFKADGFCWVHTTSGLYSVKTGYELARKIQEEREEQRVTQPSTDPLHAEVWNLKAPRKIKHLLWQCLTGCVAVCSRLAERHCGTEHMCLRCGADEETISHLLFECPPAIQTWALSDIPTNPRQFPCKSLYDNFDFLLCRAPARGVVKQRLEKFPWLMWYLWKAKNDKVFNGVETAPIDTLHKVVHEGVEWSVAQQAFKSGWAKERPKEKNQEERGQQHLPRCQVDAFWAVEQSTFGGGLFIMVLHDGTTRTGSMGEKQVITPLHAEMHSLLWAMRVSLRMRQVSMHFESDCLQMVKMIEEEEVWPALASEWEDFLYTRSLFDVFSLSFIPCDCNARADLLAKGARAKASEFSHVNALVPSELASQLNPIEPV